MKRASSSLTYWRIADVPADARSTLWFCAIAFFWCGYLFLEGSDFGVGMLLPLLGRERRARSAMIGSIDPVWDGYEVWLIVAVGATFAAFPKWYATVLSACYPVLFLTLVTLILRVVAFEFRGKASARWRRWWERALVLGSLVPPLAWGLILTVQLTGLPITAQGTFTGRPWDVLAAVPILGAVAFAVLCVLARCDLPQPAHDRPHWPGAPVRVATLGLATGLRAARRAVRESSC